MKDTVMNSNSSDKQFKKYYQKYKYMKKQVKRLILENAALCDEVAKIQEDIVIVKDERKFLLRKLLELENETDHQGYYRNESTPSTNGPRVKIKKRRSHDEGGKNISQL